jgi:hypothetical protein
MPALGSSESFSPRYTKILLMDHCTLTSPLSDPCSLAFLPQNRNLPFGLQRRPDPSAVAARWGPKSSDSTCRKKRAHRRYHRTIPQTQTQRGSYLLRPEPDQMRRARHTFRRPWMAIGRRWPSPKPRRQLLPISSCAVK